MSHFKICFFLLMGLLLFIGVTPGNDKSLTDYRTPANAIRIGKEAMQGPVQGSPGKLGLRLDWKKGVGAVVQDVLEGGIASKSGIQNGDVVEVVRGKKIADEESMRGIHQDIIASATTTIQLRRDGKDKTIEVTAAPWSMPLSNTPRVRLGFFIQPGKDRKLVEVKSVPSGSGAQKAGVRSGDVLVDINGVKLNVEQMIPLRFDGRKPGDEVTLGLERSGKRLSVKVTLEGELTDDLPRSWNDKERRLFKKPVYNLAVLLVEFPDQKMNEKIKPADWEKQLFSKDEYKVENATGQKVYGSMNDYYQEISYGKLRISGKAFAPVALDKKRIEYSTASPRNQIMEQALDKLFEREGAKILDDYDGVFFMYAGGRAPVVRGNILWPHRSTMPHKGKRYSYFICPEGGEKMYPLSVMAHEFGHLLGLPDLYARPEVPDMEGLGLWCAMANGAGNDGRPVHFSAWCKEQMGWISPVILDPRVPQKLILAPMAFNPGECVKILLRPDGTEYILLENRDRKGYDRMLPGAGLLIWRVVDGKPSLEESHGIAGPAGPGRFTDQVPYPSRSNKDFTPQTVPSSTPVKQGGWPLYITQIEKLPDGRILLQIGYEYY